MCTIRYYANKYKCIAWIDSTRINDCAGASSCYLISGTERTRLIPRFHSRFTHSTYSIQYCESPKLAEDEYLYDTTYVNACNVIFVHTCTFT